jgi:hypothetical protein
MYKEGGKKFVAPTHTFIACVFGALLLLAGAALMFRENGATCGLAVGSNYPQLVCIAVLTAADHGLPAPL